VGAKGKIEDREQLTKGETTTVKEELQDVVGLVKQVKVLKTVAYQTWALNPGGQGIGGRDEKNMKERKGEKLFYPLVCQGAGK